MCSFMKLPVELTANILMELRSYVDLYRAISAGPFLLDAFRAYRQCIFMQVARNAIEPEALGAALMAGLCPRTLNLPWDREEARPVGRAEYQRRVSQYIKHWEKVKIMPFPTRLRDLVALQQLTRIVEVAMERFVDLSWRRNTKYLPFDGRMHVQSQAPPLSHQERATLQKALFQYEMIARIFGLGGGEYADLPLPLEEAVMAQFDGLGLQQLLTVHNWILDDYRTMVCEFEADFVAAVKRASRARARRSGCSSRAFAPANGSAGSSSRHAPRTLNASDAVLQATEMMPYFSSASSRVAVPQILNNERHTNESFTVVLQSFGLGLYRQLTEADAQRRHEILTSSYHDVVRVDREWFTQPFRRYCARYDCPIAQLKDEYNSLFRMFSRGGPGLSASSTISNASSSSLSSPALSEVEFADDADADSFERARAEARDNLRGNLGLPNDLLAEYVETIAQHPHNMSGEDRFYLIGSGWWFWGDERLRAMQFRRHALFAAAEEDSSTDYFVATAAADPALALGAPGNAAALNPFPPAGGELSRVSAVLDEFTESSRRGRSARHPVAQDYLARLALQVDEEDWVAIAERYRIRGRQEGGSGEGEERDVLRDLMGLSQQQTRWGW